MKNSIKSKYILGLSIIIIFTAVVLNILVRQVFTSNLEKTIKSSMMDIMKSSSEYIEYNIKGKKTSINEEDFLKEISRILSKYKYSYQHQYEIRNLNGKVLESYFSEDISKIANNGTSSALSGKTVVNLLYQEENMQAVLSYPLYYKGKLMVVININTDFKELYNENIKTIRMITLIELVIFILIFVLEYLFTATIIQPIIILTKEIKKIEQGDYEINLNTNRKDEIGILLKEFIQMKDKIKEQIETIRKEKDKVLEVEKSRREFFNNVTHELKTPLTAVSGYAQILLQKDVKDVEFKNRAVERIYLESERLHKLVLDLIKVSKGASFLEEEKKFIDMKQIIEEICEDMHSKAEKYSIAILEDLETATVYGQENKIRQLIINVLDNAIKYSFTGENVRIKSFSKKNFYVLNIENRGEPILDQVYNSIFDPFVRGKENNEVGSSGLGLYICNEIVKEHNGEIYIENGKFVKVTIKIPCVNK